MKFNNTKNIFSNLILLQLRNYLKDPIQIILGWGVTTITLLVWLTFKDTSANDGLKYDPFVLASAIGVSIIRNAIFNITRTLQLFKKNSFFETIFSTPIRKKMVFINIIIFNQILCFIVSVFLFAIGMCYEDQRNNIGQINWYMFITSYIMLCIMGNLIAFILAFSFKSVEISLVIANIFYFGGSYFLGLGIPYNMIATNKTIVLITYIFPTRYPLNIMQASWKNLTNMELNGSNGEKLSFGYNYQLWIPYVISMIIIIVLLIWVIWLFIKKFEYGSRKFRNYINVEQNLAIIYQLRKCNSKDEIYQVLEIKNMLRESKKREVKNNAKK